jgi:adenylylsulfate kinase-like enzyme
MIIWLMGMSGAGKSTLAEAIYDQLKPNTPSLVRLDGDEFREIFGGDADYTIEGRAKNAERISKFCQVLDRQNIHVIAAVLSIFPEWQAWNRLNFSSYYEIFLDVPVSELERRDTKGLYAGAKAGEIPNVVGVDIPFPTPRNPDLIIDQEQQIQGVDVTVRKIIEALPRL